jgi:hypothetical protein
MTDWHKARRQCPICKIVHEWTPFCLQCRYEYQCRKFAENEDQIAYEAEPVLAVEMKKAAEVHYAFFKAIGAMRDTRLRHFFAPIEQRVGFVRWKRSNFSMMLKGKI